MLAHQSDCRHSQLFYLICGNNPKLNYEEQNNYNKQNSNNNFAFLFIFISLSVFLQDFGGIAECNRNDDYSKGK